MTSVRIGNLQDKIDKARNTVDYELSRSPIDYTKIAVYERRVEDLKDELKLYYSIGELLQRDNCQA